MTIPPTPAVIGMKPHVMFHIRLISIVKFMQLSFFSASFWDSYLFDSVAASISMQVIIIIIIIIIMYR